MHIKSEEGFVCNGFCCTKMDSLSVKFGNTNILDDINLHVHCGEFTAIIGPNGAGKSTLIKAILGEVKFEGSMSFVNSTGFRQVRPQIGYVPQNLNIDPSSPTSVLDFYIACRSKFPVWLPPTSKLMKKAEECMKKAKADHLLKKRLGSLSGGELQRVLLALALEPVPGLLLLDEPVSGMDQNGMELFYQMLSELRTQYDLSIILVSHDFNLVGKHADRLVLLNKTVLASGTPSEVFSCDAFKKQFMPWSIA